MSDIYRNQIEDLVVAGYRIAKGDIVIDKAKNTFVVYNHDQMMKDGNGGLTHYPSVELAVETFIKLS